VFVISCPPACSPNTMPNSPSRATIGGAGLFTRMTPYTTPTSRPTANEMSSPCRGSRQTCVLETSSDVCDVAGIDRRRLDLNQRFPVARFRNRAFINSPHRRRAKLSKTQKSHWGTHITSITRVWPKWRCAPLEADRAGNRRPDTGSPMMLA
jgi:hypothetical protein